MSKPGIPQGTRDFSPEVVRKRQYILGTLKTIFERFGFQPLETPAMENLVTLTGKYGEEGDRLIFKILNNGLHEKKDADKAKLNDEWQKLLTKPYSTPVITERALRYDLTIPFARYVVMNQNDLALPFRRYQMQPVWRADRPQHGRYREFWQCDCDVVGSTSLINEAELLCIYVAAFHELNIPVTVKINSRKLLTAIAELCNAADKVTELTIALDKLDKIGWDGVANELATRGISEDGIALVQQIIAVNGDNDAQLAAFKTVFAASTTGLAGIKEIGDTLSYYSTLAEPTWKGSVAIDISLARGLNYYTGIIAEVVCSSPDVKMGSIGGGGRYDDLTGLFGLKGLSGVGVSFGIDRIYDVMEQLSVFPATAAAGALALIVNFGGDNEHYGLQLLRQLRAAGVAVEIFPDAVKFDKQLKYANKRGFQYVLLPGDEERLAGTISVKNFATGEQTKMT
ncbi:MAG: histidine--tRNA ligase, partial [Chitinophagia bacterium]|nr:histidine--tRNA ligase [Chitinophagia bacterium]